MAVNKRKVLELARKHATKGAKDKALKEYAKLLKLDPRDAKLRLEIGDAHRRWGQLPEAVEAYTKVAEQFMKEGFDARAVAVFKQILNLDSESLVCYEPLSELYQRMGLTGEATNALQVAADAYHRAGDKQAALGLLRKMATLDPSNTTSRLKVADLLHKEGMNSEALIEYDAVVAELIAQGDAEGTSKVYERLLDVEPDRVDSLTGYTRNLIARGAPERAEAFARRALEADRSPAQFELLGEVLRATGRDEELVELYRELAELYRERGDEERTREILQRYVSPNEFSSSDEPNGYINESELSPANESTDESTDEAPIPGSLDKPGGVGAIEDGPQGEFGDENTLIDEDLMADDSLLLGEDESSLGILADLDDDDELPIMDPDSGPDSNEMTRIIPEDAPPLSHDVDQLFAEATVYLRYGKRDQAIANLENILEIDSTHRAALEKLGEACVESDDRTRAVELWSRAAKLALEDDEVDAALAIRNRIAAIDDAAASALVLDVPSCAPETDPDTEEAPIPDDLLSVGSEDELDASIPKIDGTDASGSVLDEIELDDIEIDVEADSFETGSADPLVAEPQAEVTVRDSADEIESEAMTIDGSIERKANPKQIGEDIEEADFYLQQGLLDEAEAIYSRVLEVAPGHPHALVRMGEVAAQRGEDPGSTGSQFQAASPVEAVEIDVPDEPVSMEIGEELTDWDADLTSVDELEIGPNSENSSVPDDSEQGLEQGLDQESDQEPDLALDPELDAGFDEETDEEVDEQELSVADLSVGSFDPIDATSGHDSNGTTRDLPDTANEQDGSLDFELEAALDVEVEFDLDLSESSGTSDPELDTDEPAELEFVVEPPLVEDVDELPSTSNVLPPPALAVTSVDFGDDSGDSDDSELDRDPNEEESAGDDIGFDLAAEIGQALGEDPNENTSGNAADTSDDGFASVFAAFKKGVDETLTDEDTEAHYDLGIAYREMGLFDDAITEFQLAVKNPDRRLGCLHLLGLTELDAGRHEDAIAHLQSAIGSGDLDAQLLLALRFDLGRCFEHSGDIESAKREYLFVHLKNPNFNDVGSRLEELSNPEKPAEDEPEYESFDGFLDDSDEDEGAEPMSEAEPVSEADGYENFDDVIAESNSDPMDPDPLLEEDGVASAQELDAPEDLEMEAIVEPESDVEIEQPSPAPEPLLDPVEAEPELVQPEPEPDPPKARKKRKISFF